MASHPIDSRSAQQCASAGSRSDGASGEPGLASLAGLVAVDPFKLSAKEQVELVASWEAHTAWLESLKADALAAMAEPIVDTIDRYTQGAIADPAELFAVEDSVCDEVAAAMRVSRQTARRRVQVARDLFDKLPRTRDLLRKGQCSYAHAVVVSDECELLDAAQARQVEARALDSVGRQTPAQMRRAVRRAATSICPPHPAEVLESEFARRDVTFAADGAVMATITATLPAPDAMAVWNALTCCAVSDVRDDDARTMAHKRADALTAWANAALDGPAMPIMQGKKRLETQIVIAWETLVGMNDNAGEIVGYGPIPAHYARQLAVESDSWRRLVTAPVTGHLIDYGTTTYTPPAALREYVIARDRTCQFPGCQTQGWRCDIDHVQAWTGDADGGRTAADNLITLCRRHHRLKTHNHWHVAIREPDRNQDDGGGQGADPPDVTVIEWRSPRGQLYENPRFQHPVQGGAMTRVERKLEELLAA